MHSVGLKEQFENIGCPLGCASESSHVATGRDRLHGRAGIFHVVRCSDCGLIRTDPRPTEDHISHYYPSDYHPHLASAVQGAEVRASKSKLRAIVNWLADSGRYIPAVPPGRLLEIGCANGDFLSRMQNVGWQVEGIELSENAASLARSRGFKVKTGRVEDVTERRNYYDLVVGWMVIEHLHHPLNALKKLYEISKPGGRLVISVPDAGSWEFKVFRDSWYALDLPRHLFHFNKSTVTKVLERSGWKVERIFWHRNPNNFLLSLRYVFMDRGWTKAASYVQDIADAKRHRYWRLILGFVMGLSRSSGRMTVWARKVEQ